MDPRTGRAGRVVDLERVRVEHLAEEIAGQLTAYGGSILRLATDVDDVERYDGRGSGPLASPNAAYEAVRLWGRETPRPSGDEGTRAASLDRRWGREPAGG